MGRGVMAVAMKKRAKGGEGKRPARVEVELMGLHPAQCRIANSKARFKAVCAGRRFGKSKLGIAETFKRVLAGQRTWWIAPTYKILEPAWNEIRAYARQVPGMEIRESSMLITATGGGWVQMKSAENPQSLVSQGLDFGVLDEVGVMAEEAWTESFRPALMDRKGGALFIGTPKGRNWFYHLWNNAHADTTGEWGAWHFTSADNPFLPQSEIENAKRTMPEMKFRQEIMAEFLEDAGIVFRRVLEAATAKVQEGAIANHDYAIGVDWGKHNDFTVLAVMDLTERACVYLDRFNQIDYTLQTGRLKALAQRFRPIVIKAEANAMGEPIIDQLVREGLPVQPFTTTNATKASVIEALVMAFERGEIKIPNIPVLVNELQAYEMETLPSGLIRYNGPDGEGAHDDCVIALALGWQCAATPILTKFWALA